MDGSAAWDAPVSRRLGPDPVVPIAPVADPPAGNAPAKQTAARRSSVLRDPRRESVSWMGSTVIHLGFLGLLAVWRMWVSEPLEIEVESGWVAQPADEPELELRSHELLEVVDVAFEDPSAGGSLGMMFPAIEPELPRDPAAEPQLAAEVPLQLKLSELRQPVSALGASSERGDAEAAESVDGVAGGLGKGVGAGQGDGEGGGFFGMDVKAQSVVFVVDCSSSMNQPHESEAKTRFRRLQFELLKCVGSLGSTQQFYIVFFNDKPIPMPARGLQYATLPARQKYLEWMARRRAGGETDPRKALEIALRLNPQAIYFLTDGAFIFKIDEELKQLRQRRCQIHTFSFGTPDAELVMKAVAANNRGEYHYVP